MLGIKRDKLKEWNWLGTMSQRRILLAGVIERVYEYSSAQNESPEAFKDRVRDATDIVEDLYHALHYFKNLPDTASDEEKAKRFKEEQTVWLHADPRKGLKEFDKWTRTGPIWIDQDALAKVTAQYLCRPWMHYDLMEWIIVDASAYGEIIEFGDSIIENLSTTVTLRQAIALIFSRPDAKVG